MIAPSISPSNCLEFLVKMLSLEEASSEEDYDWKKDLLQMSRDMVIGPEGCLCPINDPWDDEDLGIQNSLTKYFVGKGCIVVVKTPDDPETTDVLFTLEADFILKGYLAHKDVIEVICSKVDEYHVMLTAL